MNLFQCVLQELPELCYILLSLDSDQGNIFYERKMAGHFLSIYSSLLPVKNNFNVEHRIIRQMYVSQTPLK